MHVCILHTVPTMLSANFVSKHAACYYYVGRARWLYYLSPIAYSLWLTDRIFVGFTRSKVTEKGAHVHRLL